VIPFGPFHPDKAGINVAACRDVRNCLPAVNGYRPLRSLVAASSALTGDCLGAAVVIGSDGNVHTFAGDATKLYKLTSSSTWDDVSRTSGGAYTAGAGERWQFGFSGALVIATTIAESPQKYLLGSSTDFTALGGSPPRSRYIATVRDFVVLGGLFEDELTIHWSGLANPEHWTPGTQSCDTQTFQNGGPVRGIVGGETGYVMQAEKIQRMTYVPGSPAIFQFDEVEGGRGLVAPYSLVKLGNMAYYLASDGFYEFSLGSASSKPLGTQKWARWFINDLKAGSEASVVGGVDPVGRFIVWAYNSADNPGADLNRLLIYDWTLDEAVPADITVTALAQILTTGVTLDTMDSFGDLDSLPFSLDSPIWRGGSSLLGLFGTDRALSAFSGVPMAATFVTNDGEQPARLTIKGIRPHIDTRSITAEIATREAEGDAVTFGPVEVMEDTGVISTWASGWLARARLRVAAGANWSKMTSMDVVQGRIGKR
jgi:hypothetical protein